MPNTSLSRLNAVMLIASMISLGVYWRLADRSAQPIATETANEASRAQQAVGAISCILLLGMQGADIAKLALQFDLPIEQQQQIRDRTIAIWINFIRDFMWAYLTGVNRAATFPQNVGIGIILLAFTVKLGADRQQKLLNASKSLLLISCALALSLLLWKSPLRIWLVLQKHYPDSVSAETGIGILRSGFASTMGLIAWCAPLLSPVVISCHILVQALLVGICEGLAQALSNFSFNFIQKPEIRPLSLLTTLVEGLVNAPAGAIWLLVASIPQQNGSNDMAGNLSSNVSLQSAAAVAAAVAVANWVCGRLAQFINQQLTEHLASRISAALPNLTPAAPLTVSAPALLIMGSSNQPNESTALLPKA